MQESFFASFFQNAWWVVLWCNRFLHVWKAIWSENVCWKWSCSKAWDFLVIQPVVRSPSNFDAIPVLCTSTGEELVTLLDATCYCNVSSLEQFGALRCTRLGVRAEWISYPLSCHHKAALPSHFWPNELHHLSFPMLLVCFVLVVIYCLTLMLFRSSASTRAGRCCCSKRVLWKELPPQQHVLLRRKEACFFVSWCYQKHDQGAEIGISAYLNYELHRRVSSRVGVRDYAVSGGSRSWQLSQWCLQDMFLQHPWHFRINCRSSSGIALTEMELQQSYTNHMGVFEDDI